MEVGKTARGAYPLPSLTAFDGIVKAPHRESDGADGAREFPAPVPGEAGGAEALRFRAIWISDVHLGTRGCKVDFLLDFLRNTESEYLYLVGDLIDAWQLRKSWYWPQSHNEAIRLILRKAGRGTQVFYVPGNHDEFFRDYTGMRFGGVSLLDDMVHETADGRRFLIIHGDAYDGVVSHARWLALLGDWSYHLALRVNSALNRVRRRLGYPYWSLSAYLKQKVKNAVSFISHFEQALAQAARERGVDGVICGHIHKADLREIEGVLYANDGDWVESCTALVEHDTGRLEILRWADLRHLSFHDTVPGPLDVISGSGAGVLDEDLGRACRAALAIPPEACRRHAEQFSWNRCARMFLENLRPIARARSGSSAGPASPERWDAAAG